MNVGKLPTGQIGSRAGVDAKPRTAPSRLLLAIAFVFAAGVDVRVSDLGHGGPASNPLEVLVLVAFLVFLADSIFVPKQPSSLFTAGWKNSPWLMSYAAWAMMAATVGLLQLAMSFFIFRNLFPAMVFFMLAARELKEARSVSALLLCLPLAAIPNVALALSQIVFKGPFPIRLNAAAAVKMDVDGSFVSAAVGGLFNHPNALAVFLLPVFVVSLGIALHDKERHGFLRACSLLMAVIVAGVLYYTRAKGAWVWGAFGVGVLLAPRRLLSGRLGAGLMMAVLVLLIAALVVYSLHAGGALSTMMTRYLLWRSALVVLATQPFVLIFGSGQESVWFASATISDLQYPNAHNVFLNQAIYFGAPAALAYVMCFAWAIHRAATAMAESKGHAEARLARIALAGVASLAGCYFFEPAAESSGLAVECFLLFVVAGSFRGMRRPDAR